MDLLYVLENSLFWHFIVDDKHQIVERPDTRESRMEDTIKCVSLCCKGDEKVWSTDHAVRSAA